MDYIDNKMIVKGKISRWDEGLPLGNGTIGALLFGDEKVVFSLDRAGLWDLTPPPEWSHPEYNYETMVKLVRSGMAGNEEDWKKYKKIFDGPYSYSAPTKINAGKLIFDMDVTLDTVFTLDICDGVASVKDKNGEIVTFVSADKKVGVAICDKKFNFKVEFPEYYYAEETKDNLHQKVTKGLGYNQAIVKNLDNVTIYEHVMKDGTCFGIAFCVQEINDKKLIRYYVFNEKDVTSAEDDIVCTFTSAKGNFDELLKSHKEWWKDFWAESEITIPDPMLEDLYYKSYYLFGSGSRTGSYPMPLQGLWTACAGELPPWKGDYHHDLNTQITYMSYLRANHLDAGYSFVEYLWGLRDRYKRFAKEFHGVDGIIVPGVSDRDGNPLGGWSMYSLSPTMSIWLAKSFSDYYEFTGDVEFLKEKGYPFFRGVCDAILSIMYEKDGKLYLPLSSSPEYNDANTNSFMEEWSNNDIQLVNFGFEKIIELGKILGTDESKFENALKKLDKHFVNDRLVLCLDNKGNMIETTHRHHSHIMTIYPLKTIKPIDDESKLLIERNLLHLEDLGWGQWVGFSYPWFAGASAAGYHANRALFHLQMFARCFCYDNGFHLNGDFKKYGVSLFHYRPFTLDANYMFCDAIQEMLVQDDLGYLNLFPCIPNEWKGETIEFKNFLCRGGIYVSATCKDSKTVKLSITTKKESKIKIKNNFGKDTITFSNGKAVKCLDGEIFEITVNGTVELV